MKFTCLFQAMFVVERRALVGHCCCFHAVSRQSMYSVYSLTNRYGNRHKQVRSNPINVVWGNSQMSPQSLFVHPHPLGPRGVKAYTSRSANPLLITHTCTCIHCSSFLTEVLSTHGVIPLKTSDLYTICRSPSVVGSFLSITVSSWRELTHYTQHHVS